MIRALFLALLLFVSPRAASGQTLSVLQIKVVVVDAQGNATPVPRHLLLVSDNPASAPPRRIVTALDGTANVKLLPGNYTVESDRPVAFHGRAYQWIQSVDIAAGRDALLELTVENAEAAPVASAETNASSTLESDPSFLLAQWQDAVVAIWTPNSRASGFAIDAKGLIATNQRAIGTATAIEVQFAPDVKVVARVLATDPVRDVAILWVDPKVVASVRTVPLGCGQAAKPAVVDGQDLFTIAAPLGELKGMTSGTITRVEPHSIFTDFALSPGGAGGPVFMAGGGVIGITSVVGDKDESERGASRVVPIGDACDLVTSAEAKMKDTAPPDPTHLPVESVRPFPTNALEDAAELRAGSLSPYQMSSSDFEVAFITPLHTYAARSAANQATGSGRNGHLGPPGAEPAGMSPLMDFGNWTEYVADFPPVLLIRATPKLVEGFWTTVARGAARTQGVSLPPIKHFKSGFSRMRALCDDAEVRPVHPFRIEHRVSESDTINEGLYVFDPGALGPHCGTVKLVLYSEEEPEKGDVRVVDSKRLQEIWQHFAPYRARKPGTPGLR